MTPTQERRAAAMRIRSVDRRLRLLQKKKFASAGERTQALADFWEQLRQDRRIKKGRL